MNHALVIVDYQYDFVNPNGLLYVLDSEKIYEYICKLMDKEKYDSGFVVASKDWHPSNHYSFKKWGTHCVANTKGSQLMIPEEKIDLVINKGQSCNIESYSAFFDETGVTNGLHEELLKRKITQLTIVGVALDICVNYTLIDAIKLGYQVKVDLNGCKGISNQLLFNIK